MWPFKSEEKRSIHSSHHNFDWNKWQNDFDKSFRFHGLIVKGVIGLSIIMSAALFGTVIYAALSSSGTTAGNRDGGGIGFGSLSLNLGVNGMLETRCVDGYKFIVDERGFARQMIGENNSGVKCGK